MLEIDWMRAIISFEVGAMLSMAGSLVQGVTQNELAGPSTLGFDALIVLFVLLAQAIALISPQWSGLLENISFILFIIFFIFISLFVTFLQKSKEKIFKQKGSRTLSFFILLGLCFNLFVGAIYSILQFLFMTLNWQFPTQLWYGQFRYSGEYWGILFTFTFIFTYWLMIRWSASFRILTLGKEFCWGMGVDVSKLIQRALLISFFLEGIIICYFGVFSFMGLIFPHFLRTFTFFRFHFKRELLLGSLLSGLILMLLDIGCYLFPWKGAEIPVGMISGIVGSFLLIIILLKKQSRFF